MLKRFARDDRGLSAVEYILGGALIVLFLAAILNTIFGNVQIRATSTNTEMTDKIPDAPQ